MRMQKKRRKLRLISLLCGAAMLAGLINPAMFGGGASEVEAADAIEISANFPCFSYSTPS